MNRAKNTRATVGATAAPAEDPSFPAAVVVDRLADREMGREVEYSQEQVERNPIQIVRTRMALALLLPGRRFAARPGRNPQDKGVTYQP